MFLPSADEAAYVEEAHKLGLVFCHAADYSFGKRRFHRVTFSGGMSAKMWEYNYACTPRFKRAPAYCMIRLCEKVEKALEKLADRLDDAA